MREIEHLDLNRLVVLHALLREGGVTPAARRLGLSPSAVSHALGRLREDLGDPLLVREGNGMVATPRAAALAPALDRLIEDARRFYQDAPEFDPASAERGFVVAASDLLAPLVPGLVASVLGAGPGLGLAVLDQIPGEDSGPYAAGRVDLGLQAAGPLAAGMRQQALGEVDFAVVARPGHPFLDDPGASRWAAAPHVAVLTASTGPSHVAEATERAGLRRRVALRVPGFLLALHAVAATDLLFTAPRALVEPVAAALGLRLAAPPLALPSARVIAVWHERMQGDPGHRWLRERVVALVRAALGRARKPASSRGAKPAIGRVVRGKK